MMLFAKEFRDGLAGLTGLRKATDDVDADKVEEDGNSDN
jgi:hypothetical protein